MPKRTCKYIDLDITLAKDQFLDQTFCIGSHAPVLISSSV